MINFNQHIIEEGEVLSIQNRGFAYGDALFETIKFSQGKLLFWEDHYFRLMASMRIMRMEIPMNFTMEFLEEQILNTIEANQLLNSSARVKLTIFRNEGGFYLPNTNDVSFLVAVSAVTNDFYSLNEEYYEVDLYKDFYVSPSLLSSLKTNNKALNIVGSIYAKENNLNNCLLLNTNKQVIEALNSNVFLVKDNIIKTPPITDGCLKGVMRKQIIDLIKAMSDYSVEEASISPFDLQNADELFITNVIVGIQSVSKYRKKTYTNNAAKVLIERLNEKVVLV